ncbi:hypothetical protein MAPG_11169 [Magnaporthiopsis poae ATCC 64411]|uniref:AAA+ ATPase domain-containing protein n=1 Tax=Magnaporthiopsis poae (strain ATCC 64411 / 73-15) TaxID=644358 RepID=A0A0C4EEJ6_MAGP6|nr:hypothetical protein MAPG_11169 [Magnaporthiopsis poae ATCC 64411]
MANVTSSLPPMEDDIPVVMGIFRALLGRFAGGLDVTQTSSILTLAAFAFGTLRWLRGSTSSVMDSLRAYATIRVVVPGTNEMSTFVSEWIDRNILPKSYNKSFLFREAMQDDEDELGDGNGEADGSSSSVAVFFDENEDDDGEEDGDECAVVVKKKAQRQTDRRIECVPQFKRTWFFFRGHFFTVSKGPPGNNRNDGDDDDNEDSGESALSFTKEGASLTITCLSHSSKPVIDFLQMCREEARSIAAGNGNSVSIVGGSLSLGTNKPQMRIYSHDYRYWRFKCKAPARPLSTVHLDRAVKKDLLEDIEKYLSPITRRRYQTRSMPYQRGYLLHGPPGTGKSTLASVLAGRYGLSLYVLKLTRIDDEDLESLFSALPSRCIVLMEDIDAAGIDRDEDDSDSDSEDSDDEGASSGERKKKSKKNKEKEDVKVKRKSSDCTLSGLLNVLDGVGSQEGRIVIMTTNFPDELDAALVRPGRIDKKVYIGYINRRSAQEMFVRMFRPVHKRKGSGKTEKAEGRISNDLTCRCDDCNATTVAELAAEFGRQVPENSIAPSELQGFFQIYLECPSEAVRQFPAWLWRLREDKAPRKKQQHQQQPADLDNGVLTPPDTPVSEKADKAEDEGRKDGTGDKVAAS